MNWVKYFSRESQYNVKFISYPRMFCFQNIAIKIVLALIVSQIIVIVTEFVHSLSSKLFLIIPKTKMLHRDFFFLDSLKLIWKILRSTKFGARWKWIEFRNEILMGNRISSAPFVSGILYLNLIFKWPKNPR